jgi:type 1 glutamine amidotransferase
MISTKKWQWLSLLCSVVLGCSIMAPMGVAGEAAGFQTLFDGKTLEGWDGDPRFWSVEQGAITGRTTPAKPAPGNTFLIWRGGTPGDFELHVKFRIVGGNSGVQYRSRELDKWVIGGYQADFDAAGQWTGSLYEERGRGVLARCGTRVVITPDGKKQIAGQTTPAAKILGSIKQQGWNDYSIVARGHQLTHKVNGMLAVEVTDGEAARRKDSGLIALQLHAGPPMMVQFKEIRLRHLQHHHATPEGTSGTKKKIVFIASGRSHGYGTHEHFAGCTLLAGALNKYVPQVDAVVCRGWPKQPDTLAGAAAVVFFCDGGGGHLALAHLEEIDQLAQKGVGLAMLHYAVEVPKRTAGRQILNWIGGYFEQDWSVNPIWTAHFSNLPEHPILRGVKPFDLHDEWYYHMRFREEMRGVTPILTALPPKSTLNRPDGGHSGNRFVREAIARNVPQHVAWAYERPGGGRGFGLTGGHFHWNWANDDLRKLVLNAVLWIAHVDVPASGVVDQRPALADLKANLDEPQPQDFDFAQAFEQLHLKLPAPQ